MKEKLYDILASQTTLPLIWAYENGKRPKPPFMVLDVRQTTAVWPVHAGQIGTDRTRKLDGTREAKVHLQCFGAGCFEELDALINRLQTEAVAEMLEAANTDIVDFEPVQQVPQLIEVDYEPQAVGGFRYRYTASLIEQLETIDSVDLSAGVLP